MPARRTFRFDYANGHREKVVAFGFDQATTMLKPPIGCWNVVATDGRKTRRFAVESGVFRPIGR